MDKDLERVKKEKFEKFKALIFDSKIKHIDEKSFKEHVIFLSNKIPVLVDFYAPWCVSCTMLAQVLEKLVSEFVGKAVFVKVNIDENPLLASLYSIMSVPTLKLFKAGKVINEFTGFLSETELRKWLQNIL